MIDETHELEINGRRYRLAREGIDRNTPPYARERTPIRAVNTQVVQTEPGTFQLRPDMLEWRQTEWSGESFEKNYAQAQPGDYWYTENFDLTTPGQLTVAKQMTRKPDIFQTVEGYSDGNVLGYMSDSGGNRWVSASDFVYDVVETGDNFSAALVGTYVAAGGTHGISGVSATSGESVTKYEDLRNPSKYAEFPGQLNRHTLACVNGYAYVLDYTNRYDVWELDLYAPNYAIRDAQGNPTGQTRVRIAGEDPGVEKVLDARRNGSGYFRHPGEQIMCVGSNDVYFIETLETRTVLWRLTPQVPTETASGVQNITSASEWAVLTGFWGQTCWAHFGTVYVAGIDIATNRKGVISVTSNGVVAFVGWLSHPDRENSIPYRGNTAVKMRFVRSTSTDRLWLLAPFQHTPGGTWHWELWVIDYITGQLSQYRRIENATLGTAYPGGGYGIPTQEYRITNAVEHRQKMTIQLERWDQHMGAATAPRFVDMEIHRNGVGSAHYARAVTGWHDFGTSGEKTAVKVGAELSHQPLARAIPPEVRLRLHLRNEDNTVSFLVTEGGSFAPEVQAPEAPPFREASMEIALHQLTSETDEGGTPQNIGGTVITDFHMMATVIRGYRQWSVTVDCANSPRVRGWQVLEELDRLAAEGRVIEFKDGCRNSEAGRYTTHSVIIDSVTEVVDPVGEGVVQIVMRELEEV